MQGALADFEVVGLNLVETTLTNEPKEARSRKAEEAFTSARAETGRKELVVFTVGLLIVEYIARCEDKRGCHRA